PADVRGVSGCGRRPFPRWVVVRLIVDVHTPKANVQYTTLDRKPLKSVRNRHQTNTILNTSHEPKSTTVLELKYRSYEMFTIIQEFTEKYRGFRGSLFSIHPLSGCERLRLIQGHVLRLILCRFGPLDHNTLDRRCQEPPFQHVRPGGHPPQRSTVAIGHQALFGALFSSVGGILARLFPPRSGPCTASRRPAATPTAPRRVRHTRRPRPPR